MNLTIELSLREIAARDRAVRVARLEAAKARRVAAWLAS